LLIDKHFGAKSITLKAQAQPHCFALPGGGYIHIAPEPEHAVNSACSSCHKRQLSFSSIVG
jgi:hypothetical protein